MSESHCDQNLPSSDRSLNDEISVINNLLSVVTLTSSPPSLLPDDWLCAAPLPTLPLDLIEEIFSRLPVKLLLQLRCVCKRWNSLISDPKFVKKHLSHLTRRIHFISCLDQSYNNILTSYPLDSLFTNEVTTSVTQFEYPPNNYEFFDCIVGSCNGILCLADYVNSFVLLCNPSLGKFKELPSLQVLIEVAISYGFGYDHVNDNYKVVALLNHTSRIGKTKVKVHALGTNFWKSLDEFPYSGVPVECPGKFVSGTINWLACKDEQVIVSFDLENESFQEVPKPDYGNVDENLVNLGVLRDCLCVICDQDIWLMKEYRNKESWTKLFTVSNMCDPSNSYALHKAIYIFEDDQVLFESRGDWGMKLILYDPKTNTFKFTKFQSESDYWPHVSVESLIFPWS
ncbi:hypothetical protein TSUD_117380 [Trifolium subterraneum]|nr:hypothetical protein TSUD_117380 [Trifolium subterraneum]